MSTLFLSETDVAQLANMPLALEAMRDAFRMLASGQADNVPRVRARAPGIVLHSMIGAAPDTGLVGWKQYTTTVQAARFLVGLYDQQSGQLVALIEANLLGQLRTGAVTGLAVDLLTSPDVASLGLFGSGWQAQSQLEAVAATRTLKQVRVFSRNETRRQEFCGSMSAKLNLDVQPASSAELTVRDSSIVITATSSSRPVLEGSWLRPGTLVCAVGSNWPHKAEIDVATIGRSKRIVCDSIPACKHEAGDFLPAIEAGVFQWDQAIELADVLVGKQRALELSTDCTLFKSVGLALEDIVFGAKILQRARERKIGQVLAI